MGGPIGTPVRIRQDVWSLSDVDPWHPTILWYARAVEELKKVTDVTDPKGWPYLARIHGADEPRSTWPSGVDDWNSCQHGSWYFLPWHRMYLHYFEQIVLDIVKQKGGPADWALPFWDYSDPNRPDTLSLPPAFVSPAWPDGPNNPLREELRADGVRDGGPIEAADAQLTPWTISFSTDLVARPAFGGPITGWHHRPDVQGILERQPHGTIHVDVGGLNPDGSPFGLMSAFSTAPMDPIFWLHHCNLDRLWEIWRNAANTELPSVAPWLDVTFPFGSGAARVELEVRQILHTEPFPLRYQYDGVPVPPIPSPDEERGAGTEEAPMEKGPPPQLVGAAQSVRVGAQPSRTKVPVHAPSGPLEDERGGDDPTRGRTFLTLENVTGTGLGAGVYAVSVRIPAGADPMDYPDREVGRFSTFGLAEATAENEDHAGSGLSFSFDITDLVARLVEAGDWDPTDLDVAITPTKPVEGGAPDIEVGVVGVYRE
jgi:tyrosinase